MEMVMDRIVCCCILSFLMASGAFAQKSSVSTNVLDWSSLGTMNGGFSYSLSRHWSVTADVKYNPFSYDKGASHKRMQAKQQSYSAGTRYWPWHIYSGWWISGRIRYQEYNFGGVFSVKTSEGDRFGGGFGLGYTHMIHPHFNLELGAGLWGGYETYVTYACPVCGATIGKGSKFFILPSDAIFALAYVF